MDREKKIMDSLAVTMDIEKQTCHSGLTQNLNECEKKSEYSKESESDYIKIALLYRNPYQIQSRKNLNFEWGDLNFTKSQKKKI